MDLCKQSVYVFESKEGKVRTNGDENTGVNNKIQRGNYAMTILRALRLQL